MPQMKTEDKYKNLERVILWITNCDNKVSYLLTLQGIVLTVIFTSNYSGALLETLSYKFSFVNFGWKSILKFLEGLSLYAFFITVFISFYNAYRTLRARLDPKIFSESNLETNSVLFFESIANKKFTDFILAQGNLDEAQLNNDIDSQVFINSKICQLKFKHYNLALKYSKFGFALGLLYLILRLKNGS